MRYLDYFLLGEGAITDLSLDDPNVINTTEFDSRISH